MARHPLMVIHQNHDYSHLPGGRPHYDLAESQHNMQVGGGLKHMYMVLDADCQLIDGQIRPRALHLAALHPLDRAKTDARKRRTARPGGYLTRLLRKSRRKLGRER